MIKNSSQFFFAGLGIGIAVGILTAPRSGAETRKSITEGARQGRRYLDEQAQTLKESARDAFAEGEQTVRTVIHDGAQRVADTVSA